MIVINQAYLDKFSKYNMEYLYQIDKGLYLAFDIEDLSPSLAKFLRPVSFKFINEGKTRYGFIAQEVQEIMPSVVTKRDDGYLGLSYFDLIAPLYALVQ